MSMYFLTIFVIPPIIIIRCENIKIYIFKMTLIFMKIEKN